jgi:hypothetical protein
MIADTKMADDTAPAADTREGTSPFPADPGTSAGLSSRCKCNLFEGIWDPECPLHYKRGLGAGPS